MSGFRSKGKGNEYESKIGKILGEWWWGDPFPRSHGSGSSATMSKGDVVHAGDLYVPPSFPWCVECKFQNGWSFDGLMKGNKELIISWWIKAVADAQKCGRPALLVFTKNRFPDYVMFEYSTDLSMVDVSPICFIHPEVLTRCIIITLRDFMSTFGEVLDRVRCDARIISGAAGTTEEEEYNC